MSAPLRRALALSLALGLPACGDEPVHVSEAAAPHAAPAAAPKPPALPPQPLGRRELGDGLVVDLVRAGDGQRAARVGDRLTLHYTIRAAGSDEELDSTARSGIPFHFRLGNGEVVAAWEHGLIGARAGSHLVIEAPAALCYGAEGHGNVPPETDLVFEIDLVRVDR